MVCRVLALWRHRFEGEIKVTIDGLPEGVTAEPLFLCGDSTEGFLTVHASVTAPRWNGTVKIRGESIIGGTRVVRFARTASILWGKRVFGRASQVRSRLDLETVLSVMETQTEPTRLFSSGDPIYEVAMNDTLDVSFRKKSSTGSPRNWRRRSIRPSPNRTSSPPIRCRSR